MKLIQSIVIYLLVVASIFALGGWAYNEVAIKNRPLSPDETRVSTNLESTPSPQSETKKYESASSELQFDYPTSWNQVEETEDSVTILNFEQSKAVSAGFPENGVRIDIVITNLTDAARKTAVLNCDMKATFCDSVEINGQKYKITENKLNTGFIRKEIGKDLKDKRVVITFLIGTGSLQAGNEKLIDTLISSIKTQN